MNQNEMGLYRVQAMAGNMGMPGAPILTLDILVNAVSGSITGHAVQSQAVAPPGNKVDITITKGQLRATGLGQYTKVVYLEGQAVISFPPPAIGSYLAPFSAHFAVDNSWDGTGGWSLGSTDVNNVPIKSNAS